ncbi:MAG: hypothetical protein N2484_02480 [Clostridia bacterium]|nr:hypothetical protein [Clostridia bacterium]
MSSEVYKLIKKEVQFTFRPFVILFMLGATCFIQIFKFSMNLGGAIVIPLLWCWLFTFSGTVKGYGSKTLGVFVAPITRGEYVSAKYLFSILCTSIVFCISMVMDIFMIYIRDSMLKVQVFMNYNLEGMLIAYPVALFIIALVQAWSLYQGTCGKVDYGVTITVPILVSIIFMNIQSYIFDNPPLNFFKRADISQKPQLYFIVVLVSITAAAGVLYYSYINCKKDFQRIDL